MTAENRLEKLSSDLARWRSTEKQYRAQQYPASFLATAIELSKELGVAKVSAATGICLRKLDSNRLVKKRNSSKSQKGFTQLSSARSVAGERLVLELAGGRKISCIVENTGAVLSEILCRV